MLRPIRVIKTGAKFLHTLILVTFIYTVLFGNYDLSSRDNSPSSERSRKHSKRQASLEEEEESAPGIGPLTPASMLSTSHQPMMMPEPTPPNEAATISINQKPTVKPKPTRAKMSGANRVIKIAMWAGLYPSTPWPKTTFKNCKQPKCIQIDQKQVEKEVQNSDAVLFSHKFLWPTNKPHVRNFKLPPRPNPKQKWVFVSNEPPTYRPVNTIYHHMFNVTVTHKYDSDVRWAYGMMKSRKHPGKTSGISEELWKKRKFHIAWEVSHCNTDSRREDYAHELGKHIDLTIYGHCGTKKSKCHQSEFHVRSMKCYEELEHNYKFFLAFENSFCTDYVTEKLWRTFQLNLIPIVYGLYDYAKYLPANSFINVMDFNSPKHLADYLMTVASNKTLYDSYFAWKKTHYVVMDPINIAYCDLCEYLHNTWEDPPRTVNLTAYYTASTNCISPQQFLNSVGVHY